MKQSLPKTRQEVEQHIKEILSKHKALKGAVVAVTYTDKQQLSGKGRGQNTHESSRK